MTFKNYELTSLPSNANESIVTSSLGGVNFQAFLQKR